MLTLGIETSCDETSVALLDDGTVRASEVYTQEAHAAYGGVVPEVASRAHIRKVDRLCAHVLDKGECTIEDIDMVAVTDSPGLAGALLVGISFALGIHVGYARPVTGINHLEGHISSVYLEHDDISWPFLAVVVSGGHTAIYRVDDFGKYQCLGRTIDDAAGEAFDKVGKLLGFSYPAGRDIEQEAGKFSGRSDLRFPVASLTDAPLSFSFSGLKTAVRYYLEGKDAAFLRDNRPMICAAFQKAVIDSLVGNTLAACRETGIRQVALVGGVACNGALRAALAAQFSDSLFVPSVRYCTDNAAMIARAGYERACRGMTCFPHMAPTRQL
jgi:N6-L-threonylcarbamoyladenine synthase